MATMGKENPAIIEETIELLKQQMYSYIKKIENNENIALIEKELLNPAYPLLKSMLKFGVKPGYLFTVRKLLLDLKGIAFSKSALYKDNSFCGYFGLDSSSSGLQILSLVLRSKSLASKVNTKIL